MQRNERKIDQEKGVHGVVAQPWSRISRFVKAIPRIGKFFLEAYTRHWLATPIAACAAVVSTFGAATAMLVVSPIGKSIFPPAVSIGFNALFAPLLAYILYLSFYYFGMFLKERSALRAENGELDSERFQAWLRVVRYDYLAHVPTDVYLISLAALMQATLEASGTSIFWAVITSQLVDDFITFLKEPAIWNGAQKLVDWEEREQRTLGEAVGSRLAAKRNNS